MEEIHRKVPAAMKKKKYCDRKLQDLECNNKSAQLRD